MKPAPLLSVVFAVAAGLAGGYFWGAAEERNPQHPRGVFPGLQERQGENGLRTSPRDAASKPGAANSLTALIERAAGMSPAALEETLRAARRDAVPGDAQAMLRQQLLLHLLATADSTRALRVAKEFDLNGDGSATALVLSAMAAHDPRGAAAMVNAGSGIAPDPRASQSLIGVAAAWARQDAAAAQQWVRTLPDGLRAEAWSAVASVMAASQPEAAAAFALEMPPGAARAHASASLAEVWARTAPAEALTWTVSLPAEDRFSAVPTALGELAQSDPAAAAAWLLRQPPQDRLPQNTAALMGTWARSDPSAAAKWVAALPSGQVQKESMQHLLYQWAASAPEQASEWLRSQRESPARDEAVAMLSLQVSATDPEAAAVWASSISDPARRSTELHRSLSAWLRRDHTAASEWMHQAGVSVP